jgi:hypothetical protein
MRGDGERNVGRKDKWTNATIRQSGGKRTMCRLANAHPGRRYYVGCGRLLFLRCPGEPVDATCQTFSPAVIAKERSDRRSEVSTEGPRSGRNGVLPLAVTSVHGAYASSKSASHYRPFPFLPVSIMACAVFQVAANLSASFAKRYGPLADRDFHAPSWGYFEHTAASSSEPFQGALSLPQERSGFQLQWETVLPGIVVTPWA